MKRILTILLSIIIANSLSAQSKLALESIDPASDAIAIKHMRAKMAEIRKSRQTVAVVLSGGGAKGAAHVGVLRALEENGIPVDMVVGTSMGGLVGGLYSMGYSAEYLDSLIRAIDWNMMMSDKVPLSMISYDRRKYTEKYSFSVPFHYAGTKEKKNLGQQLGVEQQEPQSGLEVFQARAGSMPEGYLKGYNVYNILNSLTVGYQDEMEFKDLPVPFFCVASDVVSLLEVNWTKGKLVDALRSTMAIPIYFTPIRVNGMILIDGGTRNNFPVDIAKAMGADYIIGVDLADVTTYSDINNIPDILMQSISMMGKESYDVNMGGLDIYIHPDLTGYNMLSFGKENIADIIGRGYAAAQQHIDEIKALQKVVGNTPKVLNNKPATDIGVTPVLVGQIEFDGLTPKEGRFFFDKLTIHPGEYVNKQKIEENVSFIFGTGAFESVTYSLLGTGEPFRLTFNCVKGPIHRAGAGFRIDSEEVVSILLDLGLGKHKLYGTRLNINSKISNNPTLDVEMNYTPLKGPKASLELQMRYPNADFKWTDDINTAATYKYHMLHNTAKFSIASPKWTHGYLSAGAKYENMPYYVLPRQDEVYSFKNGWYSDAASAFLRFRYDSQDNGYFPSRGSRFAIEYDFTFYGGDKTVSFKPYHTLAMDWSFVIPMGERFSLIPSFNTRFLTGDEHFIPHLNYVGGVIGGRYNPSQIPFFGYNGLYEARDLLGTATLDARFKINQHNFVTARGGVLKDADKVVLSTDMIIPTAWAAGLEYAYRTVAGPLKADINWNSQTRKIGVYFGVGYEF